MIEYIKGNVESLTPTSVVLDNHGIGYLLQISLNTYTAIQSQSECKLYVYEAIREDAYLLFGFSKMEERDIFLLLIGVSGVGANTARMILSSLTVEELKQGIVSENVSMLQSVKGIGIRTAQRILVDLKDKIQKSKLLQSDMPLVSSTSNQVRSEALAALQMLGFPLSASQKAVNKLMVEAPDMPVEQVVKAALKLL
ncbi:MAG: Holliday junction branch migration protein RuvA [Bacteroidota bacterium]|nr:Holliday junction branch migration protein RuvA [Bacteroidota bacterium]